MTIRIPPPYEGKITCNSRGWWQWRIIDGEGRWVPYVPVGRAA